MHFSNGFVGVVVIFVFLRLDEFVVFGGNKTYHKTVAAFQSYFFYRSEFLEVFPDVFESYFPGQLCYEYLRVFVTHFWVYNLVSLFMGDNFAKFG